MRSRNSRVRYTVSGRADSCRSLNYRVDRHYWQRGWRSRLCAFDRRIRRLRPIAAANQYWQPRIFREPRIRKRKFTHKESRTAIGLDPARMAAVSAEAGVGIGMDQRV